MGETVVNALRLIVVSPVACSVKFASQPQLTLSISIAGGSTTSQYLYPQLYDLIRVMDNQLETVKPPKPLKLNPKQKKTIQLWTDELSETFGNLYQSAVKAGFRPSYALKLSSNRPNWLSETVMANYEPAQIKQGIQNIAKSAIDSRSPDDTRLKAYEILAKMAGLIDNKNTTNIGIQVQPILNSESVKSVATTTKHTDVSHIEEAELID